MTERGDTEVFQVLVRQVGQNAKINIVLGKALSVLLKPELFEPIRNLLHWRPPTDISLSLLDRQKKVYYARRPYCSVQAKVACVVSLACNRPRRCCSRAAALPPRSEAPPLPRE